MMCSRPDRPGPPTHMSHRMPTAIGAWSSFSRDRDVALTRLPLCSLMNRNHQQPTRPSLLQVSLARSQFTGKVFISTPEDTGPAYTQMKVHRKGPVVVRLAGMANERERESSQAKFSFDSEDTGPHTSQRRSIQPQLHPSSRGASQTRRGRPLALWGNEKACEV